MSMELVERLRNDARHDGHSSDWFVEHCVRVQAAAELIEKQAAKIAELQTKLGSAETSYINSTRSVSDFYQ